MSECDSSNHPVSVVIVVFVNFLTFLVLINRCKDLLQILCGCSLGGPLPSNFVNLYKTTVQISSMLGFVNPQET